VTLPVAQGTARARSADERATSVRWQVMAALTLVTTLTYLDRLNLGIAAKFIQDEFSFSRQTMGWILSAFLLGYAAFQIPGGWLGDRFGPTHVLAGAIVLWSGFTALTGFAPHLAGNGWLSVLWAFLLVRFMVGVGEAATSPNENRVVANWMGAAHRGTGASFTILGIGIGGAITAPVIAWTIERYGWQTAFYFSALLGLAVAVTWLAVVSDTPGQHPRVNDAERELIRADLVKTGMARPANAPSRDDRLGQRKSATPWARIFASSSAWGLFLGYACQGFPIYIFHTWFFTYLLQARGLSVRQGGLWGATPYLAILALVPLGGMFSDRAVQGMGKRGGRRAAVALGMISSGVLLWAGSHAANNTAAILLLAVAGGMNLFAATTFWATCIDLTQEFTGALSGAMNTFGNFGGWLSPIVTAWLATHWGWNRAFDCAAAVSFASALFFSLVDASHSLDA
jgi:MFS transporter, ACS family, glucarate transporter